MTLASAPPTVEAYMNIRLRLCKTQQENARLKLMIAQYRATQLLATPDQNPVSLNDGLTDSGTRNDKLQEDYLTLKTKSNKLLADFEELVIAYSNLRSKFDTVEKTLETVMIDNQRLAR